MQTIDDRQRILEEKSRMYDALKAGRQFDYNDRYHVHFRAGGHLSEEATTSQTGLALQAPGWEFRDSRDAAGPNNSGGGRWG